MARTSLAALLLTALAGFGSASGPRQPYTQAEVEARPDTALARPLDHWPGEADLERLRSVEGKPKAVILRTLGHPSRVARRPGGVEVWEYPWCAACCVWVRKGVCVRTFYTGGY
jgi:hypothetical protein